MGFFQALMGKGGPSPNATYAAQSSALKKGRKRAIGQYETGIGYVNPYMQGGQRGQELYESSIGVRPYDEAFRTFAADPFRAESEAAAEGAIGRQFASYNTRGFADSGPARLAAARTSQELYDRRLADWRNRLAGLGGQGLQAAQFGAGMRAGLGDLEYGYGQQRASLMGYRDNALRAQAQAGVNNLIGLGGLALRAFTPGATGVSPAGNIYGGVRSLFG